MKGAYWFLLLVVDVDVDLSMTTLILMFLVIFLSWTVGISMGQSTPGFHGFFSLVPGGQAGFDHQGCPTAFQSSAADATCEATFSSKDSLGKVATSVRPIGYRFSSYQSLELLTSWKTGLVCFEIAKSCFGLESPARYHILLVCALLQNQLTLPCSLTWPCITSFRTSGLFYSVTTSLGIWSKGNVKPFRATSSTLQVNFPSLQKFQMHAATQKKLQRNPL